MAAGDRTSAFVPYARIQEHVDDIDQQIDQYEGDADDQERGLDDRKIAVEDAVDEKPADSRGPR